jgi:diacylglycerol O-acyltransferase
MTSDNRLTGLDAAFLGLETAESHLHVLATLVLEPGERGFSVDHLRALVASRLDRVPPFRQRVVHVPMRMHHPVWWDVEPDLDVHIQSATLPAPGGEAELAEFTASVASQPLDRDRPLWELWCVDGLETGHVAIIAKIHHACIDGVAGVEIMAQLLDIEPTALPASAFARIKLSVVPEEQPEPLIESKPSDTALVRGALDDLSAQPVRLLRALRNVMRASTLVLDRIEHRGTSSAALPFMAPSTMINRPISADRSVAFAELPLDDVRMVRKAFGATINDVLLATTAGALRRWFHHYSDIPEAPLVAAIPTSVRTLDERGSMGNRFSAWFVHLALNEADPEARLRAIQVQTQRAKSLHDDIGSEALHRWAEVLSPLAYGPAKRAYRALGARIRPLANVVCSNVPGPRFPMYCTDAQVVACYPFGPVFDGTALNLTMLSYLDTVGVGIIACSETVPGIDDLAIGLADSLGELVKIASQHQADIAR